jgi:cyclase
MPIGYGGGVRDVATARRLIQQGVEKVIVNTASVEDSRSVARIADHLGSSTLVMSIDAAARPDGTWEVVTRGGTQRTGLDVRGQAEVAQALGAGELIINAIDRDGTMDGYDLALIRTVAGSVDVPVVACGGAGTLDDLASAIAAGAAAVAAGSLFVFHGRHRAVLITYPSHETRRELFSTVSAN